MKLTPYSEAKVLVGTVPEVNHRTVGMRCWIGDTAHPVARQYKQQPCTIKAVWRFGTVLMAAIVLDSGETINGLFLYELETTEGRSFRYQQ